MAKVGFWLRNANGKLAGATIYQQNGETVMREVVSPSNPKTERQILQRIIMHTIMQSYSKMKEICDHSFESIKKGQDTMAYYMKQNVQFAREKVAQMQANGVDFYDMYNFVPLGVKGFTPNQYQVAMGSLPSITCEFPSDDDADVNKILVPAIANAAPTYQDVADALGLQRGDQLTFLIIFATSSLADFGQNEFKYSRVILDPIDPDTHLQLPMTTPFLDGTSINKPSFRNENTGDLRFGVSASDDNKFKFGSAKTGIIVSGCVIASRQSNNNWLRSTTFMAYRGNLGVVYSLGDCMDAAANGATTTLYTPSEQYLNNAGEGGGQAAATGESSEAGSGTSGGTSGGQAGTSTEFQISSVTINDSQATAGTIRTISVDQSDLPAAVETKVRANNVPAGASIKIKSTNTVGAAALHSANFNNGLATISEDFDEGDYYIYYNLGGSDVASGFTFRVTADDSGGFETAG